VNLKIFLLYCLRKMCTKMFSYSIFVLITEYEFTEDNDHFLGYT